MLIPGKVLHNETQRHVRRMTDRDEDLIEHLDILIRGLHHQGLWDKLGVLCVAHTVAADSLLDLKDNQDSVLIGSPAFVANQGFTTVGVTAVIDTQFRHNASHNNNSSIGVYTRGAVSAGYAIGYFTPSLSNFSLALTSRMSAALQTPSVSDWSIDAAGGLHVVSRPDAFTINGLAMSVVTPVSKASEGLQLTTYDMPVGAVRNNSGVLSQGAAGQYAAWHIGYGMGSAELLAYETLIQGFFTNRGTAV